MASAMRRVRPDSPADRWGNDNTIDTPSYPIDLDHQTEHKNDRVARQAPSPGRRGSRRFVRFLTTFGVGVAATLAWQSYGDAARELIAISSPQFAWLAPQPAPLVQAAADTPAPAEPASPAPDVEQLKAMSVDLAAVRQSVDQLAQQFAAGRLQTAGDIATLQASQQAILRKISTPAPRPAPAPVRAPPPPSEAPPPR
jgi:hypothetical protein